MAQYYVQNDFPAYLLDINNFTPLEELPTMFRQGKNIMMVHNESKRIVTARFMNNGFEDINEQRLFLAEIWIQMRLHHPAIQHFRGFTLLRDDSENTAALIYDFTDKGTLEDLLKKTNSELQLTPTIKSKVLFGVAYAMQYVHSLHILHRNLKPSKILLNDDLEPLVSDFSLALCIQTPDNYDPNDDNCEDPEIITSERAGTPAWSSPEMVNKAEGKYQLTMKSDVFQYGQLIKALITEQETPFEGKSQDDIIFDLENWDSEKQAQEIDGAVDCDLPTMYMQLVSENPKDRPTFSKIVDFFNNPDINILFPGTDVNEFNQYREKLTSHSEEVK